MARVVHDLVRRSGNISVHVIAGEELAGDPIPKKNVGTVEDRPAFEPLAYVAASVAVLVALGLGEGDRMDVRQYPQR